MTLSVRKAEAEKLLLSAWDKAKGYTGEYPKDLASVYTGSHKTYKYVLLTGILAKAVNGKINPIALQARAPLDGAYDARSLCHKVIVPFEREMLFNALGGSNEPFLNKPARFTHLSTDNAVRRGNDQITLNSVIRILKALDSRNAAFDRLVESLAILNSIAERKSRESLRTEAKASSSDLIKILSLIKKLTSVSMEGETTVIALASIEKLFYNLQGNGVVVKPHKVNQSGSSSKEVGDIDLFSKDGDYLYSIEVKDKDFTEHDITHAFNKMFESGADRGIFIYGPQANFDEQALIKTTTQYGSEGHFVMFCNVLTYSEFLLSKLPNEIFPEFVNLMNEVIDQINPKQGTIEWVKACVEEMSD